MVGCREPALRQSYREVQAGAKAKTTTFFSVDHTPEAREGESPGDVSQERHSLEWRHADRQSGDSRSQGSTLTVRASGQNIEASGRGQNCVSSLSGEGKVRLSS